MIIGADALEIGREIRKALFRPKNLIPVNPKVFIPIPRKDGRINFISMDNNGNISYGKECNTDVKMVNGYPALACSGGGVSQRQRIDFTHD